jgi:CTP synthase
MQTAVIEWARNCAGLVDATSAELEPASTHPVIHLLPEQQDVVDLGGTMRLGVYPCRLAAGSKAHELYGAEVVYERHRHRFEFNNAYRSLFVESGYEISGMSPDGRLVELIELKSHPFFLACQYHPEFLSRPGKPHPLFRGLIEAAHKYQTQQQ